MRDLLLIVRQLAVTIAKLCGPGGVRAVIAENLLLKQQLLVLRRGRRRAPSLTVSDRLFCGFATLVLSGGHIQKIAIILRPSTLLAFHRALIRRKYRRLFSSTQCSKKPGPKGPNQALIEAIVELKSRNPRFGCPRIARILSQTFGIDIDKNVVYRVLAKHYRPAPAGVGPSWLSFIGHTRDSLWSVDLFRCESIVLRSYWGLVVIDQCTRRLVGFGVQCGVVTGADVCRMFNAAIHGQGTPRHFVDHVLFGIRVIWNGSWPTFRRITTRPVAMPALEGYTPLTFVDKPLVARADLSQVRWVSHCRDLVQLPIAA